MKILNNECKKSEDNIMRILSIDVGIKNLAYCLFYIRDKEYYEIDKWDVINICNEEQKNQLCIQTNCKHKAKYIFQDLQYCKTHAKKTKYKIPTLEDNIKKIKNKKVDYIKKYCMVNELDINNCKKKSDYINNIEQYINSNFFETIKPLNANNISLFNLGKNMAKQFDNIFNKEPIDIILIENQISPIANRMKTIQGMIMQYFILYGVKNIEFINASNKLINFINKKTCYKERKNIGINIQKNILSYDNKLNKWLIMYEKHKKQDDLSDCFLQGLWYIDNNNLINNNIMKKYNELMQFTKV